MADIKQETIQNKKRISASNIKKEIDSDDDPEMVTAQIMFEKSNFYEETDVRDSDDEGNKNNSGF